FFPEIDSTPSIHSARQYPSGSGRLRQTLARHTSSVSALSPRLLLIGDFHRDDLRFAVRQILICVQGEAVNIEKLRLREVGGKENPIRSRLDILLRFRVFQRVDCDRVHHSITLLLEFLQSLRIPLPAQSRHKKNPLASQLR